MNQPIQLFSGNFIDRDFIYLAQLHVATRTK